MEVATRLCPVPAMVRSSVIHHTTSDTLQAVALTGHFTSPIHRYSEMDLQTVQRNRALGQTVWISVREASRLFFPIQASDSEEDLMYFMGRINL